MRADSGGLCSEFVFIPCETEESLRLQTELEVDERGDAVSCACGAKVGMWHNPTPHTQHPTPNNPHPTPFTLHFIPYTPHLAPLPYTSRQVIANLCLKDRV